MNRGAIRGLRHRFLARTQDHLSLLEQSVALVLRSHVTHQLGEAVELADHHGRHRAPGLADLVVRALDQPVEADGHSDDADVSG